VNVRSLFSGVGGLDLGLERAGLRVVSQCEKDPWRRRVLAAHWPGVPCAADVREVAEGSRPGRLRAVGGNGHGADAQPARHDHIDADLQCGGFPCQDLSVAGRRAGLNGDRSGLFFEFARIADELQPRWLLVENVPGLLSSADGRDFAVVLSTLVDLGYGVAWRTLDARYFGVPQRRRRVFIVGHLGGDPEPALRALGQSGDGDLEAGECSWQEAPPAARGGAGDPRRDHAACLTANERWDLDTETFIVPETVVSALQAPNGRGWRVDAEGAAGGQLIAAPPVAFHLTQDPINGADVPALGRNSGGQGVNGNGGVRRLTPVECERLMSWPDGWTAVDGPKTPDSRRYAACGDGVVSNVAEWIGRRILAADRE
jgi:DNA (cytosine-5)-methyltransferase 1